MKDGQIQAWIDFIRFTLDSEGTPLDEELENQLRAVLDEEVTADTLISQYIQEQGLDESFIPVASDNGKYENSIVLVNYFNIEVHSHLREVERVIVSLRLAEFLTKPLSHKFDFDYLKEIHTQLFSDIFPFAGEVRTCESSKRTAFCKPQFIDSMQKHIFSKLQADRYLVDKDFESFVNEVAYFFGELEALHPFLDGNGRALRVFFYLLALNAGFEVKWYEVDPDRLLEADICAIECEYQNLIDVLSEAIIH